MKSFRYVTMQRYNHQPGCLRTMGVYVQLVRVMGDYFIKLLKKGHLFPK